ncbi:MAG: hypothetical protein J6N68_07540, partial [Shewanella sp.]|nr:hypothetical protein [Shewanella sp.]
MATTPNQKPVPSEDYANMRFNAGKFDEFMTSTGPTYTDRLGQEHMTAEGIRASADDLRSDLASSDIGGGASLVKTNKNRTAQDKFNEDITPADYQAVGNGVTNDDEAFANLEIDVNGKEIDLCGLAYFVSTVPIGNKYYNGQWVIPTSSLPSAYINVIRQWDFPNNPSGPSGGGLAIGTGAAANIPDLVTSNPSQSFIAIGRDALGTSPRGRSCIAIGAGTMSKASPGFANIAIGDFSLQNVAGTSSAAAVLTGSRNIAIGTLALHFLTSGALNIFMGRDSGHCITTGSSNNGFGYRSVAGGLAPIGLSGLIENQVPSIANYQNGLGESALQYSQGNYNVGVGHFSGKNVKKGGSNTFIGGRAGLNIDVNLSWDNKVYSNVNITGSYTQTGNIITVTANASGAVAGNKVMINFTSGELNAVTGDSQYLAVASVVSANIFTIQSSQSLTAAGSVLVTQVETATTQAESSTNTIIGAQALENSTSTNGATVVGWQAGGFGDMTGVNNTLVGQRAGYNLTTGGANTCVGFNSGRAAGITTYTN